MLESVKTQHPACDGTLPQFNFTLPELQEGFNTFGDLCNVGNRWRQLQLRQFHPMTMWVPIAGLRMPRLCRW
jgi:hypothetical protein